MSVEQLDAAIAAPVGGVVFTMPANPAIGTGTLAFGIGWLTVRYCCSRR